MSEPLRVSTEPKIGDVVRVKAGVLSKGWDEVVAIVVPHEYPHQACPSIDDGTIHFRILTAIPPNWSNSVGAGWFHLDKRNVGDYVEVLHAD